MQGFDLFGLIQSTIAHPDTAPLLQLAINQQDHLKEIDLFVLHALQRQAGGFEIYTNGGELGALTGINRRRANESLKRLEAVGILETGDYDYSKRKRRVALCLPGADLAVEDIGCWFDLLEYWGLTEAMSSLQGRPREAWRAIMRHTSPLDLDTAILKKVISKDDLPRLTDVWFSWDADGIPSVRPEYRDPSAPAPPPRAATEPTPVPVPVPAEESFFAPPPRDPGPAPTPPPRPTDRKKTPPPPCTLSEAQITEAREAIPDDHMEEWRAFLGRLGEKPGNARRLLGDHYLCFLAFLKQYRPRQLQPNTAEAMRSGSIKRPLSFIGKNIGFKERDGERVLRVDPVLVAPRPLSHRPAPPKPKEERVPLSEEEKAEMMAAIARMARGVG